MAHDKIYINQRRRTQRQLKNTCLGGKRIAKVGSPVDARYNAPTSVPVQFTDGTFGIIWQVSDGMLMSSNNPNVEMGIKHSVKMPLINAGIGSGVMHIVVYPSNKDAAYAFIKVYYNDKEDYGDSIREVSVKEARTAAIHRKEAKKQIAAA